MNKHDINTKKSIRCSPPFSGKTSLCVLLEDHYKTLAIKVTRISCLKLVPGANLESWFKDETGSPILILDRYESPHIVVFDHAQELYHYPEFWMSRDSKVTH